MEPFRSETQHPPASGEPPALFDSDRLAALSGCGLMDTPPQETFDRLTGLVARQLAVPIALLTLVDERRQFFVSCTGLSEPWAGARETPLTHSLCKHVVGTGRPLLLPDARAHPLVRDSLAIAEMGVVAYAGIPLTTATGHTVGSLAAIDTRPRHWSEEDVRTLTDLAGLAMAEIRSRTADERLRRLIETAPVGIVLVRGDRVLFANSTMRHMVGYQDNEEVEGTSLLRYIAAESRKAVAERARRWAAGEPLPASHEGIGLRRDGSTFPYRADITHVELRDGPASAAFITDLTVQHALEEELRQAQKMEAVGRLAGGIAHDFNNLLTAIMAPAELALSELPADSPLRSELREIVHASTRAASLTRQLLAFSRKQVLERTVLDLNDIVRGAEPMLRRTIGEHILLRIRLQSGLAPVFADRGQLEQVLLNLVVNAREAMEGGGTLTIETRETATDVLLLVSDTGAGMDEETRSHVFEPFFTTKAVGHGTGLGLATVYGIVTQSGGEVTVDSTPGEGTTFRVFLPRDTAGAGGPAGEPVPPPELGPRGSGTVLLVEDDEMVRHPVARMLQRLGYEVLTAGDGEAALELFRAAPERVDLVVSDVVMPRMGGHVLLERLRELRPDIPALLISGYEPAGGDSAPGPAAATLSKPFTGRELAAAIRQLLDRPGRVTPPRSPPPP